MQKNTINMKTIEIQNCTEYRDNMFKVFVNGEKHVVRFQSKIQVPDDKPFEIRSKYIWGGSPKYIFEPKDNILLQVYVNQRLINKSLGLMTIAMVLVMVTGWFLGDGLLHYISDALWVITIILHVIFTRRKSYVIREVNKENTVN
jgi:hypothetical protein